jgi:hypothetical protein
MGASRSVPVYFKPTQTTDEHSAPRIVRIEDDFVSLK